MQKTIDSVKIQTYKNFEVLIMDGNSTKETQDYLSNLEAPFFYQSKKDLGIYDAMNKGISIAKGEWLYFLGSGDVLDNKDVFTIMSNNLNNNFDLFYGNVRYDNTIFSSKFSSKLWLKNTLHHQSVFYNKNLFTISNYDVRFNVLADYDFNLNLFLNNSKAKKIDIIVSDCNKDGISKQYNWFLYQEELRLKSSKTSLVLFPILFLLVILKFVYRKIKPTPQ